MSVSSISPANPSPLYVFDQVRSMPANNTIMQYQNIENLMSSEIHIAQCQASCIKNFPPCLTSSSCTQCKKICRLLEETPVWGNICSDPSLCKEGCQLACMATDKPRSAPHIKEKAWLWRIRIKECRLVWSIQDDEQIRHSDGGHLMFLVDAKDNQGMFYHVGTVSSSTVEVA